MKKQFLVSLFIIVSVLGCGTSTLSVDYTPTPEATSAAADLAELTTAAGDSLTSISGLLTVHARETSVTRVVNGDTGTATFTWEREVDANGRTRTRSVTFNDYTKNGNAKLSHLEGQLVYTFSLLTPADAAASIVRTLKGRVTATRIKTDGATEQVVLEPDFTYTRDPATRCVHITGWLLWNNTQYQFENKSHCVGN